MAKWPKMAVCLFDVLPGERLPHVCSVGSAGPAFVYSDTLQVHVYMYESIMRVGTHFCYWRGFILAMF